MSCVGQLSDLSSNFINNRYIELPIGFDVTNI